MKIQNKTFRAQIFVILAVIAGSFILDQPVYADCEAELAGVTCDAIGTVDATDGGIFSMASYGNTLYLGMFGHSHMLETHSDVSMIYQYSGGIPIPDPGATEIALGEDQGIEESVAAFKEFDGHLYANTEDNGRLFRRKDGEWDMVYQSELRWGLDLIEYKGFLYAFSTSDNMFEIVRSSSGDLNSWSQYDAPGYFAGDGHMKDLAVYHSKLYAFSSEDDERHYWVSTNGTNWTRNNAPARFTNSYACDNTLWLSSSQKYEHGYSNPSGRFNSGIWRYEGGSFAPKYINNGYPDFSDIQEINGTLVVGASRCFKNACVNYRRDAAIFASFDGGENWVKIVSFDEESAFAVQVHKGELYAGTMQSNSYTDGYGRLYRITVPKGTANCSSVSIVPSIELLLLNDG